MRDLQRTKKMIGVLLLWEFFFFLLIIIVIQNIYDDYHDINFKITRICVIKKKKKKRKKERRMIESNVNMYYEIILGIFRSIIQLIINTKLI